MYCINNININTVYASSTPVVTLGGVDWKQPLFSRWNNSNKYKVPNLWLYGQPIAYLQSHSLPSPSLVMFRHKHTEAFLKPHPHQFPINPDYSCSTHATLPF